MFLIYSFLHYTKGKHIPLYRVLYYENGIVPQPQYHTAKLLNMSSRKYYKILRSYGDNIKLNNWSGVSFADPEIAQKAMEGMQEKYGTVIKLLG